MPERLWLVLLRMELILEILLTSFVLRIHVTVRYGVHVYVPLGNKHVQGAMLMCQDASKDAFALELKRGA